MSKLYKPFSADFRDDHIDYHNGQHDFTLTMFEHNKYVGHINYCEFQNEPHVNFIEVAEASRRRGFATAMIMWLQQKYAGREIFWGLLVGDGAAFYHSLPMLQIELRSVKHKKTLLEQKRRQRDDLLAKYELLRDCPFPGKTDAQEREKLGDAINVLHDEIDDHERDLAGVDDFYTLIDTTSAIASKEEAIAA